MKQSFINYINLTRINRPIGIGLLFLPCLFGIFLAEKKSYLDFTKTFWMIFLFAFGSVIMRSAGCILNDIFDKKFDRQIERTKNRPLASGQINQREALILLFILLIIGLLILLQFNFLTIMSGFFALTLAAIYPLMKRITYYPQVFLGLAFNFGIIMANLATRSQINFSFIILYFAAIIWTLIYDTIYAYQDIEDDLKIGVKSSAIKFGKNPKNTLLALSLLMFLALFFVGFFESLNWRFFLISASAFFLLAQKIITCDFSNAQNCLKVFKENFWIGALISIGIFLG
ncbi:MAG: 4-hydroxybenzoate polyprenyltransferase [Proteobacteria bacterium]|nr:4-hydroxybenzoate polyprenyltransferase [Pseudomonadota bacterium]